MVNHSRFALHSLAALGLCLCATACNELEKIDDEGGSGAGIPDEVQRAFDAQCNVPGCHDSGASAGGLDLSATAAPGIIGGESTQSSLPLVELGNVQGSYLAIKMLETVPDGVLRSGAPMPLGGDLESVDNAIILGWIAGASLPGGGEGGETDGGTTTDSGEEDTDDPATTTGSEIVACGLDDVAPDAANPFDIGMNAGQIPPDVGEALGNNCGCHEVDSMELISGAIPYGGDVHFATIAQMQEVYPGALPDYEGLMVHEVLLDRVQSTEPNRMPPPYYCDLGGGEVITEADRTLLIDWLTAGAPDAATWGG